MPANALRRAGQGATALHTAVTANADTFARDLAPVLATLQADGHTTLRALAAELTARGIGTRRGGRWQVSTVRNLLARLERSGVPFRESARRLKAAVSRMM